MGRETHRFFIVVKIGKLINKLIKIQKESNLYRIISPTKLGNITSLT